MSEPLFLIQDTRTFCGDSVIWWRHEGKGYTFRLDEAGRFSKDDADRYQRNRGTDRPVPLEAAERAASRHVVAGDLYKETCSSGEGS